jgi:hypothetical protein
VTTKHSTKAAGTKLAVEKAGPTKCVVIRMTAQEEYTSIVQVPIDVTQAELAEIARDIAMHGPCDGGEEPTVLLDYEIDEGEEGDSGEGDCSAVRTTNGIKIVKKK